MPIRPENKDRYPDNWKQIRERILRRATNSNGDQQCECEGECGLHHGKRCSELNGYPAEWANGMIVLTVAHLDHTPENCDESNLKAMCQRCHLRYDAPRKAREIKERRRKKKACGELI